MARDTATATASRQGSGGRRKRDRKASEQALLAGLDQVLAQEGFAAVGPNQVARAAGVDKVLVYRYFGGTDGLLAARAAAGALWPSLGELAGDQVAALVAQPPAERLAALARALAESLMARPVLLTVLAWETAADNPLTRAVAAARNNQAAALAGLFRDLDPGGQGDRPDMAAIWPLVAAGIVHQALCARQSSDPEAAADALAPAITALCRAVLPMAAAESPAQPDTP